MPYARPTLTQLRSDVAQDIASGLPGADPLLRFSNLNIMGSAQAGLANLHFGYLDWIAKQAVPFTATGEFLEGWAALVGIIRLAASSAAGAVTFSGAVGVLIPSGAKLVRGDGASFTVTAAVAIGGGGTAVVSAVADADPAGQAGAFGDSPIGTVMTLGQVIAGVQSSGVVSTAFIGGADIELDDSLRSRMLYEYQNQPQGGSQSDYKRWALQVPGVTRSWCAPNGFGAGTVVVYTMLDQVRAAFGGFPQGATGVAAAEPRATAATGDQLLVANYIFSLQPVTALIYSVAPTAQAVNFTISGIPSAAQARVLGAIAGVFYLDGAPGKPIPLAHIWSAIAAVSGVNDFVIVAPVADIAVAAGALPKVGTSTFA
ncbi:baseplate J/gp47 family protein [Janthinobacterium sp.]|uniref:baseplate J/gp47 family protein n=1 Tax=Janthinobacterium sp. TaxID=1871054 RepID=UPI00293D9978|nr:baseplate J/gp47 family protein [Janthinobacterium sp.]